jgi:uncharacterized membrane protein YhfC
MELTVAHALNATLMIGLPVGLGFYLSRRFQLGWRLWFIGAAGFLISQAGHIPFNVALAPLLSRAETLLRVSTIARLPVSAAFLGLSAGLFEEITRYLVMRLWARDARSWRKGVLLGAGHGGAESIALGGLALYGFFEMVALRGADLSRIVPASQLALAQQQVAAYWSAPWYEDLLGAVERCFALGVQVCLSVIVLQAVTRNQLTWLGLAVAWHAIIDGSTVVLMNRLGSLPWGVYAVEGVVGLFCMASLAILLALHRPEPLAPESGGETPVAPQPAVPWEIEETTDRLENTRYE